MTPPCLILCDNALPVVEAWRAYFGGFPNIEILCDDFANQEADGLVAPSNSFGRMDGGLDAEIVGLLGEDVESEVQRVIRDRHEGELLVGLAEVVMTDHPQFPFLIVAPTMRVPQNIARTANAYLAFRAALCAVRDFNDRHGDPISRLLVPGLGTSNGFMPPLRAARQMRAAYDAVVFGQTPNLDISLDAGADSEDKYRVQEREAGPPNSLA